MTSLHSVLLIKVAIAMYKSIHNLLPVFICKYFTIKSNEPLNMEFSVLLIFKCKLWNLVPSNFKNAEDVDIFKDFIYNWNLPYDSLWALVST